MKSYLSRRADCLYRQTAGSWNVLDTLSGVIIGNHLLATRRFRHVPEPFMEFHEVLQSVKALGWRRSLVCQRLYISSWGLSEGSRLTGGQVQIQRRSLSLSTRGVHRRDWSWAAVKCSGNQDVD
jgi:hypothetical protein